jgi:hypothetical protein
MVEPLIGALQAFLLQNDNLSTETAPKPGLAISSNSLLVDVLFNCLHRCQMHISQVINIVLTLVEQWRRGRQCRALSIRGWRVETQTAFPALLLEMLRIFVSLPIVLATELIVALAECTTIGAVMTFQMLSQVAEARIALCTRLHGATVRLPNVGWIGL